MNSVFRNARKYSLLPLIDAILETFSKWFNKHRRESAGACETKKLVPYVENVMHDRCAVASRLSVKELNSFHLEYSVIGLDGKTYLVDLKMRSCTCRFFDIDKYPCVHAIAATRNLMRKEGRTMNIQIHELCLIYYLIETWALAYYRTIFLVPHESSWSVPEEKRQLFALPLEYTPKNGRTQENRFLSAGERYRKKRNKSRPGINLDNWLQPPETS